MDSVFKFVSGGILKGATANISIFHLAHIFLHFDSISFILVRAYVYSIINGPSIVRATPVLTITL